MILFYFTKWTLINILIFNYFCFRDTRLFHIHVLILMLNCFRFPPGSALSRHSYKSLPSLINHPNKTETLPPLSIMLILLILDSYNEPSNVRFQDISIVDNYVSIYKPEQKNYKNQFSFRTMIRINDWYSWSDWQNVTENTIKEIWESETRKKYNIANLCT